MWHAIYIHNRINAWLGQEEGQDLIEYALLVVFISLAVIATLPGVGQAVDAVFGNIKGQLTQ